MTDTDAPKPIDSEAAPGPSVTEIEATGAASGKTRRRWPLVVMVLVAGVVVVGGGLMVSAPYWRPQLPFQIPLFRPAPLPPRVFPAEEENLRLRAELSVVMQRLADLEARLENGGPSVPPPSLEPLVGRVVQIEEAVRTMQLASASTPKLTERVEGMAKQVDDLKRTSADAAAVLRLADRLEKVEADMRALQSRRSSAVALLLAVGQLREAVSNGMPFDNEVRAVRALAGQDADVVAALEALKPRALTGLASRSVLISRFEPMVPAMVRASILPEGASWWRQTLDRVLSLVVVVREDGDVEGDGSAAVAARVSARLNDGDLAAAVAELDRLKGEPALVVAPWLDESRARLAADRALSDLTAHVVAAVGAQQ